MVEEALFCAEVAAVVGGAVVGGCIMVGGAGGLAEAGCVVWAVLLAIAVAASGTTVARTILVPAGGVAMSYS